MGPSRPLFLPSFLGGVKAAFSHPQISVIAASESVQLELSGQHADPPRWSLCLPGAASHVTHLQGWGGGRKEKAGPEGKKKSTDVSS